MGTRFLSLFLCLVLAIPAGWATERPQTKEAATTAATSALETPAADLSSNNSARAPETLSDEEEEQLQARAEEPGPEVAGGALSNLHLTYAVIALAAVALVLILK